MQHDNPFLGHEHQQQFLAVLMATAEHGRPALRHVMATFRRFLDSKRVGADGELPAWGAHALDELADLAVTAELPALLAGDRHRYAIAHRVAAAICGLTAEYTPDPDDTERQS